MPTKQDVDLVRVVGYAGLCLAVHFGVFPVAARIWPGLLKLTPAKTTDTKNRFVSIMHAVIMVAMTMYYWVVINPEMKIPYQEHPFASMQFDFMAGYLSFDSVYVGLVAPGKLDVPTLLHHVFGCASLMAAHWQGDGPSSFYLMLIFLAEWSTPLLHLGIIVKEVTKKTPDAIFGLFALSFFVCRVLLAPYALWHMFRYRDAWHHDWLFLVEAGAVTFFLVLNFYWFYKIVQIAAGSGDKNK
mmetsp:Transcript_36544/g.114513  ORF Transcript_36544/g.114513 Transcript_36544/m.114513 type:complete len:242 (-) Transcript_36544:239-964(-)